MSLHNRITTLIGVLRKLSSLTDQILVSGGNFLTIAICAHALPLAEQGKFTYVFASYMALLLLNVAGVFQGAAVRAPTQNHSAYRTVLARLQLLMAVVLSLTVGGLWLLAGNVFGWQPTVAEAGMVVAFLVLQQLADFDRRAAYVFSSTRRAIFSSAILYPLRILCLIIIQPGTVSQVLIILIVSALIPAALTAFAACCSRRANAKSWTSSVMEHLTYSRLFIAGAPLGWLWAYIPLFMLGVMHGKEQAALLGSIRGISNIANVLMEQIETKVVADWARIRHGVGESFLKVAVSRLLKIGIIFWLTGLVLTLALGQEIVTLVLGARYSSHWNLLVIGWVGYGVYFLARISGIKHRTLGANQIEFAGNIFGVAVAALAGLILIPSFSATGAAWVYVVIGIAMLVSQTYFVKKLAYP